MSKTRYIFITGGVVSSLGKGLASATLGALLQSRGFKVRLRKLDPYLNVDPGTMSPYQHGECYVTEDGAETDLDLGHYERFTGVDARRSDNVTTGSIYKTIIEKERNGDFNGGTVQVIPHVTDAIKKFISSDLDGEDFVLCEIGGTVGDIESLPFLEAIRQFANDYGRAHSLFIHCTLLPYIMAAGELKTKPTQHSVKELLSVGIQPDMLLCRADTTIPISEIKKIALFCNVQAARVIPALNAKSIYHVPENYHHAGLDRQVMDYFNLNLDDYPVNLRVWQDITTRLDQIEINRKNAGDVIIGIVGKYVELPDAYKSLSEALLHGGLANHVKVELRWIEAGAIEAQALKSKDDGNNHAINQLNQCHGILVPGGFGERGVEGKIAAINYARTHNVPFLGICFGMQMAVIELARTLEGLEDATSSEIDEKSDTHLVGLLTEWMKDNQLEKRHANTPLGGTMRLGSYPCKLADGSLIKEIYGGADVIEERHRHRFEVNLGYRKQLEAAGMRFSGMSPDGILPEIIELEGHDWFVGVQFHPELKSRPFAPHPLFSSFIEAARKQAFLF